MKRRPRATTHIAIRVFGVTVLLALLMAQMALSSRRKSAAFDETYHLVSGYAYLYTGSPRLSWEHPPPRTRAGGTAAAAQTDVALSHRSSGLARRQRRNLRRRLSLSQQRRHRSRIDLGGTHSTDVAHRWIGLTLFALDPNIIANGRMININIVVSGFMFVAVGRLGTYFRQPTN